MHKILFFIDDLGSGGAQRQMVNLAMHIFKRNHNVEVLSYSGNNYYKGVLEKAGVVCNLIETKSSFSRLIKVRRIIRKGNYDAVIAFLGVPVFIAEFSGLPFRKWKMIAGERSANPVIAKSAKSRFLRIFHLFSDHVVSNSFANCDLVKKVNPFLPVKKMKVIYNVIDLNQFKPDEEFKYKEKNVLRLVVPASYRRLKNLIGLIDAVNLLTEEEKKQIRIDWYGDKTTSSHPQFVLHEAEALIIRYGLANTIYLNDVQNKIENIIRNADAVGLFSFFEGLPNAICEGMACGKPIIATDVSDVPLIVSNKKNGVLCKAENIESITNALRFMINSSPDELYEMGKISRERAEQLFDCNFITGQYLNLIES